MLFYFISIDIINTIQINYSRSNILKVEDGFIPYNLIEKTAYFIVKDSQNKSIQIKRVGLNDNFGGDFAQNYQYLMWKAGNEPVKIGDLAIKNIKPEIVYTIIENTSFDTNGSKYRNVYYIKNIKILKNIYE